MTVCFMHSQFLINGLSQHLLMVLFRTVSKERIFKYQGGVKILLGILNDDIIKEFSEMEEMSRYLLYQRVIKHVV